MLEWIWFFGLTALGWALWRLWASGRDGGSERGVAVERLEVSATEKRLVELWAYGSGFLSSRRNLAAVLALNLALPWLLYGWRAAVAGGRGDYDFSSAYAGIFTGLTLVALAGFVIGRLLPVEIRRAARLARLRDLEREYQNEIARLHDRLDRAERALSQTREVREAGAVG